MAKQTLQERYIAALLKAGEKEVKRTSRYVVFTSRDIRGETSAMYYYIGKSGALRYGHTVATSIPASNARKQLILDKLN